MLSEDADGDIADEAEAGDKHDHEPDHVRVERAVGAVRAIGHQGQDDAGDGGELQGLVDVGAGEFA